MSHAPSKSSKVLTLSQAESNRLRDPSLSQSIPKSLKDLNLVQSNATYIMLQSSMQRLDLEASHLELQVTRKYLAFT